MKKRMKKIAVMIVLTGIMLCTAACGKGDAVKDDLYTYLSNMQPIQELQKEAINEYNGYVNNNDSNSQELLTALQSSIIPKYENYLTELNAVAAETEEVQNVKTVCLNGANKQMDALKKVAEAIESCDTDILAEADALITESETIFTDYENQLNTLAGEHDISLVNNDTGIDNSEENPSEENSGGEAE